MRNCHFFGRMICRSDLVYLSQLDLLIPKLSIAGYPADICTTIMKQIHFETGTSSPDVHSYFIILYFELILYNILNIIIVISINSFKNPLVSFQEKKRETKNDLNLQLYEDRNFVTAAETITNAIAGPY